MAETHTVLWARVLDRLAGPDPPRLVAVDPRPTRVARAADVHLPIRNGTNMALLNAIHHELIATGWVDRGFVDAHTVGFAELASACPVNNVNLLRGMVGRPGCTVFQMNGQPTAQNTRETGADGHGCSS